MLLALLDLEDHAAVILATGLADAVRQMVSARSSRLHYCGRLQLPDGRTPLVAALADTLLFGTAMNYTSHRRLFTSSSVIVLEFIYPKAALAQLILIRFLRQEQGPSLRSLPHSGQMPLQSGRQRYFGVHVEDIHRLEQVVEVEPVSLELKGFWVFARPSARRGLQIRAACPG